MAPLKFDDLSKTANEVLSDDYQTAGFQLKTKQKTSWNAAVLSSAVDLFPPKDAVVTPAKLTWKLPKPLGCSFLAVDKLEVDKAGKFKLEASTEKLYPNLRVEAKSDLASTSSAVVAATYTGVADTQFKLETKVTKPEDFAFELTRNVTPAVTVGLKLGAQNLTAPDVGVRFAQGDFVASLLSKEKFAAFNLHGYYKASCGVKVAATYQYGGKGNGQFSAGLAHDVAPGTTVKAKVQQDSSVSLAVKHSLSKGFTLLGGGRYDTRSGGLSYGLQVSIE